MSNQKKFILLRGLTRESRHWGDFDQKLKVLFPDTPTIYLDLPGAGKMNETLCPLSVNEIVEVLRNQLAHDDREKGKFIFVGMSLGGMVALEWAKAYPQDLSSVVVINSSAGRLVPFWYRLKPSVYPYLILSGLMPSKRHDLVFRKVCQNEQNKKKTIDRWQMIHVTAPVSLKNAVRQIYSAWHFRLAKNLSTKGLVLTSKGDEFVDYKCSEKIAQELDWPIEIHSWAGHELSDDDPEWIVNQIKRFIG